MAYVSEYGDGASWVRGRILGKGRFGSVFRATLKNPTSQQLPAVMAVKSSINSYSSTLRHEKQIMNCLKGSSYIIQCYGAEITVGFVPVYNLLLEYGSGGTLSDRIYESCRLSEDEVKEYTRSLLRGLYDIHSHGYVHCDLKPGNILLVPGKDFFTAKIGDFGLSKKGNKNKRRGCSWRGTHMYLSPESVKGYEQEAASDIWALGCVVLEMLTKKRPWKGTKEEILKRIVEGIELPEIPDWISEDAREFVMLNLFREGAWEEVEC
ncbi:hypothetical protein CASFOL_024811 [Castilleja foliolosa]|uniref:Protein kinase domain-containing protein n=1 Tax=Castilleja foliolosa TaxID=1961234 RepID=A0ABD3CQF6_9LAMI